MDYSGDQIALLTSLSVVNGTIKTCEFYNYKEGENGYWGVISDLCPEEGFRVGVPTFYKPCFSWAPAV